MLWLLCCVLSLEPVGSVDWAERAYRTHIQFLAGDSLEGREASYPGQRIAADYLASQLLRYDVAPGANDGKYFQIFDLDVRGVYTETAELSLRGRGETLTWTLDEDYQLSYLRPSSIDQAATMTFVGYGLDISGYDDYADVDVDGHWVIAMEGRPYGDGTLFSKEDLNGARRYDKYLNAMKRGAIGLILLRSELRDAATGRRSPRRMSLPSDSPRAQANDVLFPLLTVPESHWDALFGKHYKRFRRALDDISTEEKPVSFRLKGRTLAFSVDAQRERRPTENVVAVLEGSDPELKDEYVVVTAHYDHIGDHHGHVYNGADDNASGTATLLLLAEHLRQVSHRRSLILLWVSAEEQGLLGSKYYVGSPTVPLESIVANVNFDMVGRSDDQGNLGVIPSENSDVSTLNDLLERVNRRRLEPTTIIGGFDRFHRRSDHYSFVKADIPAVFFFAGLHDDYHAPGDDIEKLNFDFLSQNYELYANFILAVLNQDERPRFLDGRESSAVEISPPRTN